MSLSKTASQIYQAKKSAAKGEWDWRAEWSKAMKEACGNIMNKITYKIKKWGAENTIYDFRIKEASDSLLTKIKGRYEQSAKLSFAPQYTFVRHIVVECDHSNPHNPTRTEVSRNREIVESLMSMGAVAA